MGKNVYIAEKPSVARQFAETLAHRQNLHFTNKDGYMEGENTLITWCVGHLVTMSYPEVYDESWKQWKLDPLPFIPEQFRYEVIKSAAKQFGIVKRILSDKEVERIYVCTDSGREGEYIYRLVDQMAGVSGKEKRRVWIDSQTEDEILRGISEAKLLSDYDNLSDSAYLRAIEDYLMGINFSRVLTLKYRYALQESTSRQKVTVSVGRVMTCVLGMVVKREQEIRSFVKTPYYRVMAKILPDGKEFTAEWRAVAGSAYEGSPLLYKENGFSQRKDAQALIDKLSEKQPIQFTVEKSERKKEVKKPPLLYNLAELQNDCSRLFKLSPDQTLNVAQALYEMRLTTYPRTDARVLSSAVAKEITKNIAPLSAYPGMAPFVKYILEKKTYAGLEKTKYVNDKQITDHYAIIPTGADVTKAANLTGINKKVYELILRRFLAIFCPDQVFQKVSLVLLREGERFFASFKVMTEEGFRKVFADSFFKAEKPEKSEDSGSQKDESGKTGSEEDGKDESGEKEEEIVCDENFINYLSSLKKNAIIDGDGFFIKEGETSPPKRYNSGSLILAMENAGSFIEDEDLRAQIKGSGIGTSATRAEILKKLVANEYLNLNKSTQIYTPTFYGESIYYVVALSMPVMLSPKMTASWELGLSQVAEGKITKEEYRSKLDAFIRARTASVKEQNESARLKKLIAGCSVYYKKGKRSKAAKPEKKTAK